MDSTGFFFATVILGAGRAARMGRPKLLLPWGNTSILGHLIRSWRELGSQQIVVVCAAGDPNIRAELDRLSFSGEDIVENPDPQGGMFSSIICAARWRRWESSLNHWAIVLGDQPHLQLPTLQRLRDWAREHPRQVCQPTLNGRPKHPVVLPRAVFVDLAQSEAKNLKQFLADYSIAGCDCQDPGLDLDIDRPEDYERALALAGFKRPTTR